MTTHSPGLAQMAKNILTVPISAIGVEKLFNTAKKICPSHQHSLNASTIRFQMIVRHYDERLSKIAFEEYSSKNEINAQLARSIDKTNVQLAAMQAISNNELDFDEENIMQLPRQSRHGGRHLLTRQAFLFKFGSQQLTQSSSGNELEQQFQL